MDLVNFADNLSLRRLKGQKVSSQKTPGEHAGIGWVNAGAFFIN